MARPHWQNALAHFDEAVPRFIEEYFTRSDRHCLLVAAAGFDPRSRRIAEMLAGTLGDRLHALFVREERGKPDASLVAAADVNEHQLKALVPNCQVVRVDIFGDDDAPVAGSRIVKALAAYTIPADVTDIVLDMTAVSIGIGFPAAKLLLERCETDETRSFHIMIASSPELDDQISSEPGGRPMAVRGFAGEDTSTSSLRVTGIAGRHGVRNPVPRDRAACIAHQPKGLGANIPSRITSKMFGWSVLGRSVMAATYHTGPGERSTAPCSSAGRAGQKVQLKPRESGQDPSAYSTSLLRLTRTMIDDPERHDRVRR